MSVINCTPDSFYESCGDTEAAVARAMTDIASGADLLDIGGESSRPGSESVSASVQCDRVIPVIHAIRKKSTIPISLDTTQSAVVCEAMRAGGIQIVNDISALRSDPKMLETVCEYNLDLILMHMQGVPKTMQAAPQYEDVVAEVRAFFEERIAFTESGGLPKSRLLLDPGIGFGKTVGHNVTLLQNLAQFSNLGCRLLVGTSRKSFIGAISGTSQDRLPGSLATLPAMIDAGVAIVRTHDAAATRQFLQIYHAIASLH